MGNKASGERSVSPGKGTTTHLSVVIMGTGGSGKTTFMNHMRVLAGTFLQDTSSCEQFTEQIVESVYNSMTSLVNSVHLVPLEIGNDAQDTAEACKLGFLMEYDQLPILFKDPAMQAVWNLRATLPFEDSINYYFPKMATVVADDYTPTPDDVLNLWTNSDSVVENNATACGLDLKMVDAGGKREHRKQWVQVYQKEADCLLYFVSLPDYARKLMEDPSTGALNESIEVFKSILSVETFKDKPIVLCLNKKDLFDQFIATHSISGFAPEAPQGADGNDSAKAIEYITSLYTSCDAERKIIPVTMNATNKESIAEACAHFVAALSS